MSNKSPFGDAHRNDDTGSGKAAALHHPNTSADLPALYLTTSPLFLIEALPNTRDSQTGSSGPEIQVGCARTSLWDVMSTLGTSELLGHGHHSGSFWCTQRGAWLAFGSLWRTSALLQVCFQLGALNPRETAAAITKQWQCFSPHWQKSLSCSPSHFALTQG